MPSKLQIFQKLWFWGMFSVCACVTDCLGNDGIITSIYTCWLLLCIKSLCLKQQQHRSQVLTLLVFPHGTLFLQKTTVKGERQRLFFFLSCFNCAMIYTYEVCQFRTWFYQARKSQFVIRIVRYHLVCETIQRGIVSLYVHPRHQHGRQRGTEKASSNKSDRMKS